MSTIRIKNIDGTGNVFGDGNIVHNTTTIKNMPSEELIRDEAVSFFKDYVPFNYYFQDSHKGFIEKLKLELTRFYTTEIKMIFLDQLRITLKKFVDDHTKKKGDSSNTLKFEKMMFFLEQEINALPKIISRNETTESTVKTKVFISYSHFDEKYLTDLKRHFKPLLGIIDFWDDSQIKPGQKWKEEIEIAMSEAKVAILLISADFFNSDFITSQEIPKILKKASEEGTTVIGVFLKHCLFEEYPEIMQYQGLNDPKNPIASLDDNSRESMWVELVRQVKSIVNT